jgi:hypothetical protein
MTATLPLSRSSRLVAVKGAAIKHQRKTLSVFVEVDGGKSAISLLSPFFPSPVTRAERLRRRGAAYLCAMCLLLCSNSKAGTGG